MLGGDAPRRRKLGDAACRPWIWRNPLPFRHARARGIPIVPGSDPLPFADQADKVGTLCALLEVQLDWRQPTASIIGALRSNPEMQARWLVEREPHNPFYRLLLSRALTAQGRRSGSGGKKGTGGTEAEPLVFDSSTGAPGVWRP